MNYGTIGAWLGIALGVISAIGYAFAHDWRRSIYFLLGAAISTTVAWK